MIYLIASIVSSTAIYVIFRVAKSYAVKLTPLITINYLAAALLGLVFLMQFDLKPVLQKNSWIPFSILLGLLFILMFYLIGTSSQKAGITITTLASKMSLVFPVFFSLFWFGETVTFYKYLGLLLAIFAVLLTLYKKNEEKINRITFVLPLAIFAGGGLIDSLIKLVQEVYITEPDASSFTTCVFFTAFLCGITATAVKGRKINLSINSPTLLLGILLGMANFGSLFFLIAALEKSTIESSLVFALNNMLIVIVSALIGKLIFKEHLNKVNLAGFLLAFACLFILL
jgi:drug/metabolite transporter (DMT)-like permease